MDAWSATRSARGLARTKLMAFDKTGTLTFGRARVVAIESDGVGTKDVLARAAGLEHHSEHGFARAIALAAAVRGVELDHPRRADCAGLRDPRQRRWKGGGCGELRFDERPRMAAGSRPSRAGASAGGERSLHRLCRLGGNRSRRAVSRRYAASGGARCWMRFAIAGSV